MRARSRNAAVRSAANGISVRPSVAKPSAQGESANVAPAASRFAVDLQIAADAPLPSARAYITLRRVRDLGELIGSAPSGIPSPQGR